MKDRSTFCIAMALVEACRGNWESGLFFCGANVVKAAKMETVEQVMRDLFPDSGEVEG
jgi:nitronate monooxygenase